MASIALSRPRQCYASHGLGPYPRPRRSNERSVQRPLPILPFAVHIFTALGAALAFAALIYAVRGEWAAMFLCLGIALIVDGVDGTFARHLRVAEVLPRWSGDVLDLVVD